MTIAFSLFVGKGFFMDTASFSFKNIVGEIAPGCPASIRFFGRIDEVSAGTFNTEFDYLETTVRPSLIRVLINSEGGSVLHGMSVYSTIRNSSIPTECINEGMAASMASIIWAAGERSLMRDYGILMIHNPALPSAPDAEASDLVQAFTGQIETIYRKRFNLKRNHVRAIMDGKAGRDGTFFDAKGAVEAGIIPAENILSTSPQLCQRVRDELTRLSEPAAIQSMMTRISAELDTLAQSAKQSLEIFPNHFQSTENMSDNKTINAEYAAIAASLGMTDGEMKDVMARISELVAVEGKLAEANKSLSDAKTVIAGKEAAIGNLQKELSAATAQLEMYVTKEAEQTQARIETLVEAAIAQGKIDREAKEQWVEMASGNYALAESTLGSIPAREQISAQIASDPANVQAAANAAKTAEQLMAEKVVAVVGEEFEFKQIG